MSFTQRYRVLHSQTKYSAYQVEVLIAFEFKNKKGKGIENFSECPLTESKENLYAAVKAESVRE